MFRISSHLLLLFFLFLFYSSNDTVLAASPHPHPQACTQAIYTSIKHLSFKNTNSQDYWTDACNNTLRVVSYYAAMKSYCSSETEIEAGLDLLNGLCDAKSPVPLASYEVYGANLTKPDIERLRVVDYGEVVEVLHEPVLISWAWWNVVFRTLTVWEFEVLSHKAYGFASYWFWGGVLLVGIIHRCALVYFGGERLSEQGHDPETSGLLQKAPRRSNGGLSRLNLWLRSHLVFPAIVGTAHQQVVWGCYMPTRLEFLVVFLFWAMSIILGFISYDVFPGNTYWPEPSDQLWRYISDRTGIMSYANLPLLWLFSGRNNVFIWATGWSFATFNLFHRTVARIATLQAVVHSIGYTILVVRKHTFTLYWLQPWWYCGTIATIVMCLLTPFSAYWIRNQFYDLFLVIHVVFSVVTIVGLFYHTSIFRGQYDTYLWPVVVIWCFERFVRLIRLLACNIHVKPNSKNIHITKSTVTYLEECDIIRLDIIPGSGTLQPGPGQHYYIYQPMKLRGWENHPFTLSGWTKPTGNATGGSKTSLLFYVRPYDGWTRRLRSSCLASSTISESSRTMTTSTQQLLLLEGPYTAPMHSTLSNFDSILLIAGGTGVTGALTHMQDIAERAKHGRKGTRTTRIVLVWACREGAFVKEVLSSDLFETFKSTMDSVIVDVHVYVTRAGGQMVATGWDRELHLGVVETAAAAMADIEIIGRRRRGRGGGSMEMARSRSTEMTSAAVFTDDDDGDFKEEEEEEPYNQHHQSTTLNPLFPSFPSSSSSPTPPPPPKSPPTNPSISLTHHRPSIKSRVDDFISHTTSGDSCVWACGPSQMADEARESVAEHLRRGVCVEYTEERFGW